MFKALFYSLSFYSEFFLGDESNSLGDISQILLPYCDLN